MTDCHSETHIDDVLSKFNVFGKYYGKFMALAFIGYMCNNINCDNYLFTAEESGYRCKDVRFLNNTCSILVNSTESCTEWMYDDPSSFVAEFHLACQEWKRTLVGTTHSFGYMVGLLIVGPLSDRLGRKNLVVLTGVLGAVFGLSRSFVTWYWGYIALAFLESCLGDLSSPLFMLVMETAAKEKRVTIQTISCYGYAFGSLVLALAAWLFPNYRVLLRVIYAPSLLFIFYIYLMDESPRWLLNKGRKTEALAILEKIANASGVQLNKDALNNLICEENEEISFGSLLKETFASGVLLKRFLICLVWWTTSTFVNYGLSINSVFLEGSKYLNYSLLAISSMPGNVIVLYVLKRYKRKLPLLGTFFLSGLLCLTQPFVPNIHWLSLALYFVGKLMSNAYFDITYIYTSEIFPTYTRNSMHALCSSLGRVGSIVAPQTPLLMVYWKGLPAFVFGCASLAAGFITLFAPDTADDSLPDNVRQAEALGCALGIKSDAISLNPVDRNQSSDAAVIN